MGEGVGNQALPERIVRGRADIARRIGFGQVLTLSHDVFRECFPGVHHERPSRAEMEARFGEWARQGTQIEMPPENESGERQLMAWAKDEGLEAWMDDSMRSWTLRRPDPETVPAWKRVSGSA